MFSKLFKKSDELPPLQVNPEALRKREEKAEQLKIQLGEKYLFHKSQYMKKQVRKSRCEPWPINRPQKLNNS